MLLTLAPFYPFRALASIHRNRLSVIARQGHCALSDDPCTVSDLR